MTTDEMSADRILDVARKRGREVLAAWIADGMLVDATEASRRRGMSIDLVHPDEVVSIIIDGQSYYLACALERTPAAVARVNAALGSAEPAPRVLWWRRTHGGISGMTIADAIRAGGLERCVQLAESYADEHGYARPGPP